MRVAVIDELSKYWMEQRHGYDARCGRGPVEAEGRSVRGSLIFFELWRFP
jgi:hypothetical protein